MVVIVPNISRVLLSPCNLIPCPEFPDVEIFPNWLIVLSPPDASIPSLAPEVVMVIPEFNVRLSLPSIVFSPFVDVEFSEIV